MVMVLVMDLCTLIAIALCKVAESCTLIPTAYFALLHTAADVAFSGYFVNVCH